MTGRILLVTGDHPRRRALEDLLAHRHAVVRDFPDDETSMPWTDSPPDLLVIGAFGNTQQAVSLVQRCFATEPDLSVLVADAASRWPEALRHEPGLDVDDLSSRAGFQALCRRLLERRELLHEVTARRCEPADRLAAAVMEGTLPAVREASLLLGRLQEKRAHVILAGEPGTLRRRVLQRLLEPGNAVLEGDIDRLSPAEQGAVLRLVQQGRRVVATATTRFSEQVKNGAFRTDLYYALGGTPVTMVPLRERAADVEALARACGLEDANEGVFSTLAAYEWTGNVRELELVVHHALLLAGDERVDVRHLVLPDALVRDILSRRFHLRIPQQGISLEEVEREVLRQTLQATGSNVTEAARRLSVGREKLRYRLRRHGLGR